MRPFENQNAYIVRPVQGWARIDFAELWRYRELLYFLTWRNVIVRYKQTALGGAWAVLQPFLLMVVFTVAFGRLANIDSNGIPYPIFAYTALLPWTFFANGLSQSANSLIGSANLISKVYFPRLAIPVSAVIGALVDFFVAFSVLVGMMVWYDLYPRPIAILVAPLLLLLTLVTSLGLGLWLSALNVSYRDVQYIIPFLIQLLLFATPIAYPASIVPGVWRTVLGVNPMAGVVEGFRWSLLGSGPPPGPLLVVSVGVAILLLASGIMFFRRAERTFADVV